MPTGNGTTTRPHALTAATSDPLDEAIVLTKRLKLPYLRKAMAEVIPTVKAQRWDPAELLRVLLADALPLVAWRR
jgi:hypothetical protein